MKTVLVITPRSISPAGTIPRIHVPLGALAVASQLKKDGFDVELFDTSLCEINETVIDAYFQRNIRPVCFDGIDFWKTGITNEEIISKIRRVSPDAIAFSCCTVVDREDTKEIIELINEIFPKIPIVLGGHEAYHNFEKILNDKLPKNRIIGVYCVSIGLGQPNISDIINYAIDNNNISRELPDGAAFLKDGNVVVTESKKFDINDFALFDYSLLKSVKVSHREKPIDAYSFIGNTHAGNIKYLLQNNKSPSYFPLFTSYGCGHNCMFCDTDQYLLRYDTENVIKMIEQFDDLYGIDYIDFMDNNFAGGNAVSRKTCFDILKYISEHKYPIGFSNGLTFESMMRNDFELLRYFEKQGNVIHISFPCENGNDRILNMVRKPHTVDMIKKTLSFAKKYLKSTNKEGFFIGGFPSTLGKEAETPAELENTIAFIEYLLKNDYLQQAIFLKLSPVTSIYRDKWEELYPDKSFVHCLFSKGTNIWEHDAKLLEDARIRVAEINKCYIREVTRKL